jgi:hypothetical protein
MEGRRALFDGGKTLTAYSRRTRVSAYYRGRSMLLTLVRQCCRVRPYGLKFAPRKVVDCREGRDGQNTT